MKNIKIALAQINFTVGDLEGNREKIVAAHKNANNNGADLVIFSEMAITGYPPEDLVLRRSFQDDAMDIVRRLAGATVNGTAILVGGLWREGGEHLYNAAVLLDHGEISHIICKYNLPNYGVFDEKRVFTQAPELSPIEFRGLSLGVMICEDMWDLSSCKTLKNQGADLLISLNASPFESNKHDTKMEVAIENCRATKLPLIYVNQVGGQDELVFDGGSFVLSGKGNLVVNQPKWQENLLVTSWENTDKGLKCHKEKLCKDAKATEDIYAALRLGLKDYVTKNNFSGVVIGMSGGIDSALTAVIAVDALGKENVNLVMMPSKYTSEESLTDAKKCADLLGVRLDEIAIKEIVKSFDKTLATSFAGMGKDATEENIQSRIRGDILMALSNKFGYMVLTTGNKSEMAVGYATLYGDMCGGFNALKDIYKMQVFELAKWRNKQGKVIPKNIIKKPPTAELREGQTDQDNLPAYDILDKILHKLIELRASTDEIVGAGYERAVVEKIAKLVRIAEYKRRQAAPGVKITRLAFGKDRRYPITNNYNL